MVEAFTEAGAKSRDQLRKRGFIPVKEVSEQLAFAKPEGAKVDESFCDLLAQRLRHAAGWARALGPSPERRGGAPRRPDPSDLGRDPLKGRLGALVEAARRGVPSQFRRSSAPRR